MRRLCGPVLTAEQMRAAEVASEVPLNILMDRAGAALAECVARFGGGRDVLVLCGPGSNGGDGYVAARVLAERGVDVRVAASALPETDLARNAARGWRGAVETLIGAEPAPVLIDALFGTGMTRALTAEFAEPLRRLSPAASLVIAADLPSGIHGDTGADFGAVKAGITLAMGMAKPAHLLQPSATLCGQILIADIGIDAASDVAVLARPALPAPGAGDNKYTRGMAAVVASDMAGAASLSASAAARLCGYIVLCGTAHAPAAVVRRDFPDVIADRRLKAVLIGPGLGQSAGDRARLAQVIASDVPAVLDAGALRLIDGKHRLRDALTILTPHAGEFNALFGAGSGSKIDRARDAADRTGATILFKGADTVIASPGGQVTLAPPASAWLASAGTGDVLAGLCVGLLASGISAHDAACAAVWVHGEAARRAGPRLIADDLIGQIAPTLALCL